MTGSGVRKLGGDKASRVAALRAQVAAMESGSALAGSGAAARVLRAVPDAEPSVEGYDLLKVGGDLARLLPGGGLERRAVTELNDCPALAVELLARVTQAGGFAAVVGWPELSLAQVIDEGEAARIIAVPDPGAQPWEATSVLVEGLDLVIHHGAAAELSPTRARPILAKLRAGHAALVTVGPHLPGARLTLRGEVTTYRGIGRGAGRIRGVDLAVTVQTKRGEQRGTVTAGQRRRLELV
ncbi:hypothetical protein ACEE90_10840 [Corynebacterium phoceense]